jgi:WD40 repeat protein
MFSPDGQRIITASEDETGRVWNAASGQPLAILEGHSEPLREGVFSPDGQHILTASDDDMVRIFRILSLSEIADLLAK